MRKSIFATAAVLAAFSINVADAAEKKKPVSKKTQTAASASAPIAIAKTYNWSGPYIGAHAGWAFGSAKQFDRDARDTVTELNTLIGTNMVANFASMDNFQGGIYAGYNIQSGNIVTGIEADINLGEVKRSASGSISGGGASLTLSGYHKEELSGTARMRLGYAFDNVLPYISAGLAIGQTKFGAAVTADDGAGTTIGISEAKSKTVYGYTVGAGLEYGFTNNVVGRIEYNYRDYGKTRYTTETFNVKEGIQIHQVRIGVAYKF